MSTTGEAPIAASRPHMPGYGLAPAPGGEGLLPWSWAVERLTAAHNYWVATVSPSGAPHLAAVWGLWTRGRFVFSTGRRSRKARNLAAEGRCVVTPEHAEESVVVEGIAGRVTNQQTIEAIAEAYVAKYGSGFPDPSIDPLVVVRPTVVFGIIEHEGEFTSRATRWTFAPR